MASYTPPTETLPIFDNAVFEQQGAGLTIAKANLLYLRKTFADTATALETFTAGIKVNSIEPSSGTSLTLGSSTAKAVYICSSGTGNFVNVGGDSLNLEKTLDTITTNPLGIGSSTASSVNIGRTGNTTSINSATVNIRSTASTTATINIANIGGTALAPTNGSVNIANGSENPTVAGYTTQVNISTGKNSGQISLGNFDNATVLNSSTISIGNTSSNNSYVYIGNGNGVTNDIQIASGTAGSTSNASTVSISAGATTGSLTLGNANNSILLNGAVTLSKPLILGSLPTLNTQIGFKQQNVLSTFTATGNFTLSTLSLPVGVYLLNLDVQINMSIASSLLLLNFTGTGVNTVDHLGNLRTGSAYSYYCTFSQIVNTTASSYTVALVNTGGTISSVGGVFQAVRIG